MTSIFENAYFGKSYRTRDGSKAIFICQRTDNRTWDLTHPYACIVEGYGEIWNYFSDGRLYIGDNFETENDIISEWEDDKPDHTMTKEELEQKAFNVYCNGCKYCEEANAITMEEKYEACQQSICNRKTYVWKLINGYQRGYSDAIKEIFK